MRTEIIVESREARLRLDETEAHALIQIGRRLASTRHWWGSTGQPDTERSVLSCLSAGNGWWRVRIANAVGLLVAGDLQLIVEPKIPTAHLLYLLAAADVVPRLAADRGHLAPGTSLWELVARWYLMAVERLLRADLAKDYSVAREALPLVRGRTDLVHTARAYYAGRVEIMCEFDEFDIDTPLNRVLKAAARAVASSTQLPLELRRRAARLTARMASIGPLHPSDAVARLDRRTAHYEDALGLARHVLGLEGRAFYHGTAAAWAFLIRTPEAVEDGIRVILAQSLGPQGRVEKRGLRLIGTTMTLNPDLVFGGSLAVADVKYKLTSGEWDRSDLYQLVAFATGFRVRHAAVISFRSPRSDQPPVVRIGDVRIAQLAWPADIELPAVQAAEDLCGATARWLERVEALASYKTEARPSVR
jgi:5-methylcytosine-specific restriction enzyme subunit McrC